MADLVPIFVGIESATLMIEKLHDAFTKLESHTTDSSDRKIQWKDLEEYFTSIERSLKKSYDELQEREMAFEAKASETQELLEQREAAVAAKEQAFLDRVQEGKDLAAAAIDEARNKYQKASPEPNVEGNLESKVSSSLHGDIDAPTATEEKSTAEVAVAAKVDPRPELKQFCEQMDAKGLRKFISDNLKILTVIREALPVALKSATSPAQLVLDSLEGFYPPAPDPTTPQQGNKRGPDLQGLRRSRVLLMESVAPLLVENELDALTAETKQQAKTIADEWKPRLADGNALEVQAFLQLLATFKLASEFDEDELCKLVFAVSHRKLTPELCRSLGLTHKMPGVIEDLISSEKQIEAVNFVQAFELNESFPLVPLLKAYLTNVRRAPQGKGGNAGDVAGQKDGNAKELFALKAVMRCIVDLKLETEYPLDPLEKRVAQLEKAKAEKKRAGETPKPQPKRFRANGGYNAPRASAGRRGSGRYPSYVTPTAAPAASAYRGTSERYPSYVTPTAAPAASAYRGTSERYPTYVTPAVAVAAAAASAYDYSAPSSYEITLSQGVYGQQQGNDQPSYHFSSNEAGQNHLSSYGGAAAAAAATSANYAAYYTGSGMQSSNPPYQ